MAKYRYRIEGGRYGGELVVGETNPGFALHYSELDDQEELIEAVLVITRLLAVTSSNENVLLTSAGV